MISSDHLSQKATAAFLAAVVQAIHSIDETPRERRSSTKFLQILDASLEAIGQFSPDLSLQERDQMNQLALDLKMYLKDQPWVGFENLL